MGWVRKGDNPREYACWIPKCENDSYEKISTIPYRMLAAVAQVIHQGLPLLLACPDDFKRVVVPISSTLLVSIGSDTRGA